MRVSRPVLFTCLSSLLLLSLNRALLATVAFQDAYPLSRE
jgi:hypothetical protein